MKRFAFIILSVLLIVILGIRMETQATYFIGTDRSMGATGKTVYYCAWLNKLFHAIGVDGRHWPQYTCQERYGPLPKPVQSSVINFIESNSWDGFICASGYKQNGYVFIVQYNRDANNITYIVYLDDDGNVIKHYVAP